MLTSLRYVLVFLKLLIGSGGGRVESLHIMSWRSNSERQEKSNGQDGCGNAEM